MIPAGKNAEDIRTIKIELEKMRRDMYDIQCIITGGATPKSIYGDLVFTHIVNPLLTENKNATKN